MGGFVKISCILCSYNRPRMVQDALQSVSSQNYDRYELIVIDDSDAFDIHEAVSRFAFPKVTIVHNSATEAQIAGQNRLAMNCNAGLRIATGDLVCFLGDDDYYYPDWFRTAAKHFEAHSHIQAAFGKLCYHFGNDMAFPEPPRETRFFPEPVRDPFRILDHNQVMHRRFTPPYVWNECADRASMDSPDGFYWREIARHHVFHPIHEWAAVKRIHTTNLQRILDAHRAGNGGRMRE